MAEQTKATLEVPVPIIDSHIHLYPASELHTLAWCEAGNPLGQQHSLDDYTSATNTAPTLEGFIFVETDRIHDLQKGVQDGSGWEYPLVEVDWLKRIALGQPRQGEGHGAHQKDLCLAIVPWAPLPSGVDAMEAYVKKVKERAREAWGKVRGFRYLVQYKPRGTMLGDGFIEGLRWLGRNGFSFDLGVDHHRDGDWQLEEALEMVTRAHEGVVEEEKVTFILGRLTWYSIFITVRLTSNLVDHLCKPDMTLFKSGDVTEDPRFITWRHAIGSLSRLSKTYVKLSGCFSEIPEEYHAAPAEKIFEVLQPWLIVVLTAFRGRIMFGSDWPVCTIGIKDNAWHKWALVVQRMCQMANLNKAEEIMLWSGTAIEAYNIKSLM